MGKELLLLLVAAGAAWVYSQQKGATTTTEKKDSVSITPGAGSVVAQTSATSTQNMSTEDANKIIAGLENYSQKMTDLFNQKGTITDAAQQNLDKIASQSNNFTLPNLTTVTSNGGVVRMLINTDTNTAAGYEAISPTGCGYTVTTLDKAMQIANAVPATATSVAQSINSLLNPAAAMLSIPSGNTGSLKPQLMPSEAEMQKYFPGTSIQLLSSSSSNAGTSVQQTQSPVVPTQQVVSSVVPTQSAPTTKTVAAGNVTLNDGRVISLASGASYITGGVTYKAK